MSKKLFRDVSTAQAGMDRDCRFRKGQNGCIPCVRRDGPKCRGNRLEQSEYSPRTRDGPVLRVSVALRDRYSLHRGGIDR